MSAGRMVASMIGAFGGGAVGRMLGGRMGGMIGSMAGSMLARGMGGSRGRSAGAGGGGGIGDLLGGLMGGGDQDNARAAAEAMPENEAMILVKAMCNAAKADGRVDEQELEAIMGRVGDLEPDEEFMLRAELKAPLDLQGFLAEVPEGMEIDVYAASLLPIEVDTASEVEYLQQLGRGLGLSGQQINSIHEELGLR